MGKVKINKNNKNRVLLTELLPYEVPMIFSNEGFYSIISKNQYGKFLSQKNQLSQINYGIPFNFEIGKSLSGENRVLSVIHPHIQLKYIELYEKYNSMMLHLCSKSPISLRRITKVARFYYSPNFVFDEDASKSAEVEVEPDILDEETKYIKSYFTYKPIDLIYKFYDRMEFRRLEQRFNYMMTFDISKCFYHIYTHSIAWAVKDKASSKRNASAKSFENEFDKIMQRSNYNETNGIVVGPEISRIFAEIILQRIDVDVIDILDKEHKIKYGFDYEVRRYVDDYFVFANDDKSLDIIKAVFQNKLSYYKLYINHSKTDIKTSPFISDIHVAKREINQLLVNFWNSVLTKDEMVEQLTFSIRKPYTISQNFIKDFQCVAKRNDLTYDIISKDVVRFFKNKMSQIFSCDKFIKEDDNFEKFLLSVFDILIYCYSLNINANTTFKVAQTIVLTCKFFEKNLNNQTKHTVFSKIKQDIDNVFTDNLRKSKQKYSIEILNIILAIKKLGNSYMLTSERIEELFGLNNDNCETYDSLNYFQIITLLYYIENKDAYKQIRENIEKSIINRFTNDEDKFRKSELFMLFFDFICCPFIAQKNKQKILRVSKFYQTNDSNDVVDSTIREIAEHKKWFTDWNTDIDFERILKKKEWGSSY